jgi:phage shock protein C
MQQVRLMRSETDKMIAGVCGGIAAYLGVDSVFVRLAFLILLFASGIGFLLYLILMIIMPSESRFDESSSNTVQSNLDDYSNELGGGIKRVKQHPKGPVIAAGLLIFFGIFLLTENLGWLSGISSGIFWAVALITLGIYLLARSRSNK